MMLDNANMGYSMRYIDHAREIAGKELLQVAPEAEDLERNTDLITLAAGADRYAFRVRRPQYRRSFGHEFTIRSRARGGGSTEIDKIRAGWGDCIIYGFGGPSDRMTRWFMGDLDELRWWLARNPTPEAIPNKDHVGNYDGTWFAPFTIDEMPRAFVMTASWYEMQLGMGI